MHDRGVKATLSFGSGAQFSLDAENAAAGQTFL